MVKNLVLRLILDTQDQIWAPKSFFSKILLLLNVRHCCKLAMYAISKKTNKLNLRKQQKFVPPIFFFFFFKNLALPVTRYHAQLSSCTISEKNNDPILRKLSDGQTDKRMRVISQDAVPLTSSIQNMFVNEKKSDYLYY